MPKFKVGIHVDCVGVVEADVILCAYVDGVPEYEKSVKECQP